VKEGERVYVGERRGERDRKGDRVYVKKRERVIGLIRERGCT
jgi:hypothetical protein